MEIYHTDDVWVVQLAAEDRLVAPALVGPPSRRLVTGVLLGLLAETLVSLTANLELLNGGVAGHAGDKGSQKGAGLEDLGHDGYSVEVVMNVVLWKKCMYL
jgi:hypothetical protein